MMASAISGELAFTLADDCYHKLSDDPYETETNWWSWNVPTRKLGGWLHAAYHPNRRTVTWRVYVWGPNAAEPSRMPYYRKMEEVPMPDDPDLRNITFPG